MEDMKLRGRPEGECAREDSCCVAKPRLSWMKGRGSLSFWPSTIVSAVYVCDRKAKRLFSLVSFVNVSENSSKEKRNSFKTLNATVRVVFGPKTRQTPQINLIISDSSRTLLPLYPGTSASVWSHTSSPHNDLIFPYNSLVTSTSQYHHHLSHQSFGHQLK